MAKASQGLRFDRYFTRDFPGEVYGAFEWKKADTEITNDRGEVLFIQRDVDFPVGWTPNARKITASKYFYGERDTPERETSGRDLIGRVSETFADWAARQKYFASQEEVAAFRDDLTYLALDQRMAFNSPVWFNVGVHRIAGDGDRQRREGYVVGKDGKIMRMPVGKDRFYPQTSACFIQSVDDTMEGIMELASNEARLFKHGSGTGTNLSSLRSSRERLSGGGKPSGPLAYWAFYDKVAGIVKSGGKTRRAAKMDILDISHPDIVEFIQSKMLEERKMHILMEHGISYADAFASVNYQNTNISVRVTDEFLRAVENDEEWQTVPVHNIELADQMPKYKARDLLRKIAEAAWECGDPGMQYDTTINAWHTTPKTARINASNPCSEYMQVDNSSCNLASLNLMKFRRPDGSFDVEGFSRAVRTTAIAQDLEFDNSSFPTRKIAENSHRIRPLGMGYANLGSLVMSLGLAYDSPEARAVAASITALMTGKVYETSTEMAEKVGPFEEYEKNKHEMQRVIEMHRAALKGIDRTKLPSGLEDILEEAEKTWDRVVSRGKKFGFRNGQATVLAPTGTIGYMMDCATLGVEPEIGLVQTKLLFDGGVLRRVNPHVPDALRKLGYSESQIAEMTKYVAGNQTPEGAPHLRKEHYEIISRTKVSDRNETVDDKIRALRSLGYSEEQLTSIRQYAFGAETMEGAPYIKEEHLGVFDTANKPSHAKRSISPRGHLEMMAAVQPFVSGAISKTVNLPRETTVEQIEQIYMDAGRLGLKSVALYRDGSKLWQPLSFSGSEVGSAQKPSRRKLPTTRDGTIHKFDIAGHEGYLTVGKYSDGSPGEVFMSMSKEGSTLGGIMDSLGVMISLALQHGVPLEKIVSKFRGTRFDPKGLVREGHSDIHEATSVVDYIGQFLEKTFIEGKLNGNREDPNRNDPKSFGIEVPKDPVDPSQLGGFCATCGTQMEKIGNCMEFCRPCNAIDPKGCGG
jgi:ribonucleoside-diphosphate reductase alpha chain